MRSHHSLIRFALCAAVLAGGALGAVGTGCISLVDAGDSGPPRVTVVDSLTTVRFDQPTPAGPDPRSAALVAAKNEYESFQVVVDAGAAMSDVEVVAAEPLRGPGGAVIPTRNLTVYREVPYPVGTAATPPSDSEGSPGLWPDALIPARDSFYGERRNAFPVDLAGGGKLVAWIDILVPRRQRSGSYAGSVAVRDSAGQVARISVSLDVLGFRIPSTSRLVSAFGLDKSQICRAHSGNSRCRGSARREWKLASLYAQAGLENRVTISTPVATDSDQPPASAVERRLFARHVVPLLHGQSGARLRGARLTSMSIHWNCLDSRRCLGEWRRLARRYGFADRLWLYLCDEPGEEPGLWIQCRRRGAEANRQWRGVRKLVTATIQGARQFGGPSVLRQIEILVPVVNDLVGMQGTSYEGDQRPLYDSWRQSRRGGGRSLWLYTSCRSFGCGDPPHASPFTVGWPGYAIDEPASHSRAMGWMAFLYRASGELYYQTTASLPRAWRGQYLSGGNGDGTLFYPGTPHGRRGAPAIGGRHAIPIESIRLKRIRDGREDFEYLSILSRRSQAAAAREAVESLFGPPSVAMHNATVAPAALEAARRKLAALIG